MNKKIVDVVADLRRHEIIVGELGYLDTIRQGLKAKAAALGYKTQSEYYAAERIVPQNLNAELNGRREIITKHTTYKNILCENVDEIEALDRKYMNYKKEIIRGLSP